jgi:hypothetical protein
MMVHVFRPDRAATHVHPHGNLLGQRYQLGDWPCVSCGALMSFCARFGLDHAGDCPGRITPAAGELAGSDSFPVTEGI